MSVERLRQAADRLDALATTAPAGEWKLHKYVPGCLYTGVSPYPIDGPVDMVAYIAAMHPGVGKAMAAWLRLTAERHKVETAYDSDIEVEGGRATVKEDVEYCGGCGWVDLPCPDEESALAVADAILGGAA